MTEVSLQLDVVAMGVELNSELEVKQCPSLQDWVAVVVMVENEVEVAFVEVAVSEEVSAFAQCSSVQYWVEVVVLAEEDVMTLS